MASAAGRVRALVAYDGTEFAGFQRQTTQRTVQAVLENALACLYGQPVTVSGAGRTDAGVHARGQVVSWTAPGRVPAERVAAALAGKLPADVALRESQPADDAFDPRRQARARVYRYQVVEDRWADPLRDRYVTRVMPGLDGALLCATTDKLVGDHDFRSLCTVEAHETTWRTLDSVRVSADGALWTVEWRARSFLRKQVRCMMGVLLATARGHVPSELVDELLAGRPWPPRVAVAPPQGLVLERVEY